MRTAASIRLLVTLNPSHAPFASLRVLADEGLRPYTKLDEYTSSYCRTPGCELRRQLRTIANWRDYFGFGTASKTVIPVTKFRDEGHLP